MVFVGSLYLCLHYLATTIKDIKNKSNQVFTLIFQLIIALMSVVIYAKYTYTAFGYYLGLVLIPVFMVCSVIYCIKATKCTIALTIISIFYFILCIPMFAIYYDRYPTDQYYTYFYPQQYLKPSYLNLDNTVDTRYVRMPSSEKGLSEEAYQIGLKAMMLMDEGKYEEAIAIHRQVIALEPYDPSIYYNLSICYYYIEQYDPAFAALDSAILLNPENPEYYNLRGLMYYELREPELALGNLKKSLELDSTHARAYLNLAFLNYYLYENTEKANEALEKFKSYDPEYASHYSEMIKDWRLEELNLKAQTLDINEKRYDEAAEIYRQIIDLDPENIRTYSLLISCYYRTEQYELAISVLDSATEIEPENATFYRTRGWMYAILNNREPAFRDLERSLELNSTSAETYLIFAFAYLNLDNNRQKARESIEKVKLYDMKVAEINKILIDEIERE